MEKVVMAAVGVAAPLPAVLGARSRKVVRRWVEVEVTASETVACKGPSAETAMERTPRSAGRETLEAPVTWISRGGGIVGSCGGVGRMGVWTGERGAEPEEML